MRSLRQFLLSISIILLCAGLIAAADLESAKRAYQHKDYATALRDSTALAERGNADAQVLLGKMYLMGHGVLKNPDAALQWFKAAAAQGNADGEFLVGSMYLLPHSDIAAGLRWMRLAAEQGNQDAQLLLGKTYIDGLPELPRDPVQGEMWLRLAAKNNLPFYEAQLAAAEKEMSPEQIAKGKALAAAWKAKPGLRPEKKPAADGKAAVNGKAGS
jgi:TPR repeat protein